MRKRIRFYGITVELILEHISYKKIPKYVRTKLEDADFYIQKKRNGSYMFYCQAYTSNRIPTGYYVCEFSFREPQEDAA